ncbi:MAG: GAF domain-containing protein [Chloroflexi bacterium]|nr:GAF domain-containing protein [Chloroflexota bacterium]
MSAANRSPDFSDWREIASLGEQLVNTTSLLAQRDRIVSITSRLMPGRVDVWLHENLFRLPDWDSKRQFPLRPPLEGLQRVIKTRKPFNRRVGKKSNSKRTFAAVPIEDQGFLLGALQVTRSRGPNFEKEELELLESIASIVAVALYASHRVEVERFRLGQLNLVREVSAQIANVLDVNELARRVTELIQKTFHYYYVGIFTLRPGATRLRFRASSSVPHKGRRDNVLGFEVEVGQGLIGEVAATGERIVAADVRSDPRYRYIERLPETRSEVAIPLKLEDRVLGVMDVQSDQLNAFHPNDLLLLEALADNIARAVEGARLYNDVHRRAEQLALVAEVSKSVTSTLDLNQLMGEAAGIIRERSNHPYVHLFTVHPNRRLIEYEAGSGKRSQSLKGYSIPLDDSKGIIPWAAREGKTVLANDVNADPRYHPSQLPPKNTRSELAVPLMFGERVLGVLDIQSDRLNAFTEDDLVLFEAVGGTIAAAIRNADLYQSEQWRRQVADSLREVAGLLSEYVGVDEALEMILTELERNLPVDAAAIWLFDDGELYLAAAHGGDAEIIEQMRLASPEADIALTQIMFAAQPVIRKPSDPMWPSALAAGFDPMHSALAAPLRVSDQPVGVISLAHHQPGRYGHEAQAMTTTFASYAAVAIENARLYDLAQEQAYASAALLQVAQAVVSLSDLDEILGTIIRIMPILVGVGRAALYLWDSDREVFLPKEEFGLDDAAKELIWNREFAPDEFRMLSAARKQGQTVVRVLKAKDAPENWLRFHPSAKTDEALHAGRHLLFAVPLLIKSDLFGVLLAEEADGGRRFRSRRLEIINGIAQQAALAIQNDRLQREMVEREHLETEVRLARQIQQTFIPDTLPERPEWELAARWKTARQVGGDFYDVIELPNHKLGLFIADVADKGMPAALFMALTRTLVRAAVIENPSPADALRRVNELLIPDTHQGMFVTAVYAVLNENTGELTYANAGHNPPFWVRTDGRIEKLTRTGIALGVVEMDTISQRTIQIFPGESLLLYTDGLTEAFSSNGDMFGEERLLAALQCKASSAEALLDDIEMRVNEFVGTEPASDDLTMLVVRRK